VTQVPRVVARVNRRITNPVQMRWAPYLPPWAVIEHTGRRSGRTYQTPVIVSIKGDVLYVPVLYGEQSDWIRNLLSAGGGHVRRAGRRYRVTDPELRSVAEARGRPARALGSVSGRVLRAELTRE
jgi:deazaflavin-dependent oxidoreductase (nitroreductase family)